MYILFVTDIQLIFLIVNLIKLGVVMVKDMEMKL